jgi:hypothetical protein
MVDVKVRAGNNRQCDLLAYDAIGRKQYHVESSVTHCWQPSANELRELFDKKFRGVPQKREGKRTDYTRNRNYFENICQTYENVGFDPQRVERIFVIWSFPEQDVIAELTKAYKNEYDISVAVMSFRNEILLHLTEKIGTSNYEDEVLRTLSLLRQRELQQVP